ncbi:MAG: hypothetical protein V4596_03510 [Bdellovibrionota bacterium]
MKSILSLGIVLLMSFSAFAEEVRTVISEVQEIVYDGKNLEIGYTIGGGCKEHNSVIEVNLTKVDGNSGVVTVNVVDVSNGVDMCEALLHPTVKIDLEAKVKELIRDQEIYSVEVQLPKVILRIN